MKGWTGVGRRGDRHIRYHVRALLPSCNSRNLISVQKSPATGSQATFRRACGLSLWAVFPPISYHHKHLAPNRASVHYARHFNFNVCNHTRQRTHACKHTQSTRETLTQVLGRVCRFPTLMRVQGYFQPRGGGGGEGEEPCFLSTF